MPHDGAPIAAKVDVGGVMLDRPFRIQRLGHFGFNVDDTNACMHFYSGLLGLRVTDTIDLAGRFPDQSVLAGITQTKAYFLNHGTDHHSFAIFPKPVLELRGGRNKRPDMYVNQLSWQVGSLQQVRDALDWLQGLGNPIHRIGRDMPGSNWHSYPFDSEGHINELYYGMEQIGWNLRSKPPALYDRGFHSRPELPQVSEYEEIRLGETNGIDMTGGHRIHEQWPLKYNVGGVLLGRPFKIDKIGPARLWVKDMDREVACYTRLFGLRVTEEVTYKGGRAVFLRANTEHHSLALYEESIRDALGIPAWSSCLSIGLRVGGYRQLKDAVAFMRDHGVEIRHLPQELTPGMDYTAFAIDPQGHAAQLYCYMENIGWDCRPRPADMRRTVVTPWPEVLEAMSDEGDGEVFLGPLG